MGVGSPGLDVRMMWGSAGEGHSCSGRRGRWTARGDRAWRRDERSCSHRECDDGWRRTGVETSDQRLERNDATDVGLNPEEMTYLTTGKIQRSSEKAVRDAGSISVTVI